MLYGNENGDVTLITSSDDVIDDKWRQKKKLRKIEHDSVIETNDDIITSVNNFLQKFWLWFILMQKINN